MHHVPHVTTITIYTSMPHGSGGGRIEPRRGSPFLLHPPDSSSLLPSQICKGLRGGSMGFPAVEGVGASPDPPLSAPTAS